MEIKICGLANAANAQSIINMKPSFVGFIFYPPSPRYIQAIPALDFPDGVRKVGVFVNETKENILKIAQENNLDYIQLHGKESPDYCAELKGEGLKLIKAFSIFEAFDFSALPHYAAHCDYFLFDTKGDLPGGNGVRFNWNLLHKYTLDTPFMLSGGIGLNDLDRIQEFKHEALIGIDVNSGFEEEPGFKRLDQVQVLINKMGHELSS